MRDRFSGLMISVALAAAGVGVVAAVSIPQTTAQAPAASAATLKTPWGEPDLQGIWTDETDPPAALPQVCEQGSFHRGRAGTTQTAPRILSASKTIRCSNPPQGIAVTRS
jgi:hypothetical protein